MENTYYNDDQNGPVMMPPQQPLAQRSLWDYLRENKGMVILGVLVLAALIWWFCMRKNQDGNANVATVNVPPGTGATVVNPNGFRVTRVRGGGMF